MLLLACTSPDDSAVSRPELPDAAPAPAALRRLTQSQLHNALHDLFGDELVLPTRLEPDESVDGLVSVGAALTTISPRGVEQYEDAAYNVAEQVVGSATMLDGYQDCTPTDAQDAACAGQVIEALGLHIYRRPVTDAELQRLLGIHDLAASTLGSFEDGLTFALSAMLQSPNFLYRVETGEPDGSGLRVLNDYELASRLSFFFWNSIPDDELLELAARGELHDPEVLLAQSQRLLDSERSRDGVRAFFSEMLHLYDLDDLSKDPLVFPHMDEQVGPSAREETLLGLEHIVFDLDGDYRDVFTTRRAFLDRKLASIYGVQAPAREGFGEAMFDPDGPRAGLLGQVSFLALNAHPVSSSATRRGVFVREVLLCQDMPDPPANVDASIPEPTDDAVTLRDRVQIHLQDPSCAGCHNVVDPIGLGLENFDGIGRFRSTENGAIIDASGVLDGAYFADARGLGVALHNHDRAASCLASTLYRWGLGHSVQDEEEPMVDALGERFAWANYSIQSLMLDIATSPHFTHAGELL